MARVLLRLYLSSDHPIGPGKVEILESIRDGGSISQAARGMNMSYHAAWLIRRYRAMERATRRVIAKDLAALERNLRPGAPKQRLKTSRAWWPVGP